MRAIKINDINNFMKHLFTEQTFDSFLLGEGEICTSSIFNIDGHINKDFYSDDELDSITEDFNSWNNLKDICSRIIKGNKVPSKLKLILLLPQKGYEDIISHSGSNFTPEDIAGLSFRIVYENNSVMITTGSSYNLFSMDKTLDNYWDNMISTFLGKHFDIEVI